MRNNRSDLHVEQKRALVIMLIFALLFFLIAFGFVVSLRADCAQLSSLFRSKYSYSATVTKPVLRDDYYRFNAGISFMRSRDSFSGLNADILMQPEDSYYTDAVDWNTELLDTYCVAISAGLARSNNLSIGDLLYSKHVVDGTIHEYTVETILPEISSSITTKDGINTDGIILMGYDRQYVDNITHSCLAFTNKPIGELTEESGALTSILYRTDEIFSLIGKTLPYCLLFIILSILVSLVFVRFLTRLVKYNFRRLVALGVEKEKLNGSYNRLVNNTGVGSVLIAFAFSCVLSQLLGPSSVAVVVLCTLMITEVVALLVSSWLSKRQLWR